MFGPSDPTIDRLCAGAGALATAISKYGYNHRQLRLPSAAGGPPTGDELMMNTADGGEQDVLLRLFLLGHGISAAKISEAIGEATLAQLVEHDILVPDEPRGVLRAPVQVYPLELPNSTIYICTDWDVVSPSRDAVMPIGVDSLQLAMTLFRAPVAAKRCVDVCCGSGIQALVAASLGASFVLACDLSPRAVRLTRFNAVLNRLERTIVVAEAGDAFDPIDAFLEGLEPSCLTDEQRTRARLWATLVTPSGEPRPFDLLLANPPFVAVPDTLQLDAALYVSGGTDGAELVRALVHGAQSRLAPGGVLLIVTQLPNIDDAHEHLLGAPASPPPSLAATTATYNHRLCLDATSLIVGLSPLLSLTMCLSPLLSLIMCLSPLLPSPLCCPPRCCPLPSVADTPLMPCPLPCPLMPTLLSGHQRAHGIGGHVRRGPHAERSAVCGRARRRLPGLLAARVGRGAEAGRCRVDGFWHVDCTLWQQARRWRRRGLTRARARRWRYRGVGDDAERRGAGAAAGHCTGCSRWCAIPGHGDFGTCSATASGCGGASSSTFVGRRIWPCRPREA